MCVTCSPVVPSRLDQFARKTGDLRALSKVDLEVLALTYELESRANGISHLRVDVLEPGSVHSGTIKFFNVDKHFGFIVANGGGGGLRENEELFFHQSAIVLDGDDGGGGGGGSDAVGLAEMLAPGTCVTFTVDVGRKGKIGE